MRTSAYLIMVASHWRLPFKFNSFLLYESPLKIGPGILFGSTITGFGFALTCTHFNSTMLSQNALIYSLISDSYNMGCGELNSEF